MARRTVLVTGSLAEPRLKKLSGDMTVEDEEFVIVNVGVKVAALMTGKLVERRLRLPEGVDRVIMPGRFRGDLQRLADFFGTRFERGPDELADLPEYLGKKSEAADLSRHDCLIFAEIVDATLMTISEIVERSRFLRSEGADVIDLGCLPDTPFAHLEAAVAALKADGAKVSVDSFHSAELSRATRAGADYLLSLTENNADIVDEGPATPVLVSAGSADLDSLERAADIMISKSRAYFADPILDPIHYGFAASVARYVEFRRRRPDAPMLMGVGNLTELTDADTVGVNALLMGLCSELRIQAVLAVQVSPHCRSAIREFDRARREYFAAREASALPRGFGGGLLALHDRKPFAASPEDIAALAATVRDANYRIEVAKDGVHIYNRDGHHVAADPFDLYSRIAPITDPGHAFYLGVETAHAEIAWRLGKRYAQDEPLSFGVVAATLGAADEAHLLAFKKAGTTQANSSPEDEGEA